MIFVTVGNANQGFRRLLDAVEFQAREGILKEEEIVFQSGHTSTFSSVTGRLFSFISLEEFEQAVREAEVVISHAGARDTHSCVSGWKNPGRHAQAKKTW